MIEFDNTQPVTLILTGLSGTGKTTLSGGIAPPIATSFINTHRSPETHPIHWHAMSLSPPLQRMLAARTRIEGQDQQDRQCYEILNTLLEIFNYSPLYGAPPFSVLVEMVRQLMAYDVNDGEHYMAQARKLIEDYDAKAIYKNFDRTVSDRYALYKSDLERELEDLIEDNPDDPWIPKLFGVVVSDLETEKDFDWFDNRDNVFFLHLTCDEDVRQDRIDEEGRELWVPQPKTDDFTLDTTTNVERMLLADEDLPYNDHDLQRGPSKAKSRCIQRLKAEEFKVLVDQFKSIFNYEVLPTTHDFEGTV